MELDTPSSGDKNPIRQSPDFLRKNGHIEMKLQNFLVKLSWKYSKDTVNIWNDFDLSEISGFWTI